MKNEKIKTENKNENKTNVETENKPEENPRISEGIDEKPAVHDPGGISEKYFIIFGMIVLAGIIGLILIRRK